MQLNAVLYIVLDLHLSLQITCNTQRKFFVPYSLLLILLIYPYYNIKGIFYKAQLENNRLARGYGVQFLQLQTIWSWGE